MTLLPHEYLDAVVSIEEGTAKDSKYIATGFMVSFHLGHGLWQREDPYKVFLVTNRHVFEKRKRVMLRFRTTKQDGEKLQIDLVDKKGKKNWCAHQDTRVDIAVAPVPIADPVRDYIERFSFLEEAVAFKEDIHNLAITQADEIFAIGFPAGLAGEEKHYAIVRSGIIARLDDEILDKESSFLIDSYLSAGNSGGPVVLKPSLYSVTGTKAVNKAYLIGVVSSYIPHEDMPAGSKTRKPRAALKETSGLAWVVPMDCVRNIVHTSFAGSEI
ncbi:MAG: trypsin-like peptidase domain-containing protein [Candidatus Brocadiales bacterium]|nr:trypsin-like peptidase domain-containing protein [Candidatus Bathyanammoxibius sp.]